MSNDPYTNAASQHRTEVEPDTFSFGSTIVSTFQVGRVFGGGSANIGWARSGNNGASWTNGFLPGTTAVATPPGPFSAISDPAVAFDARHGVWLISSLGIPSSGSNRVLTSRSTDGGLTWSNPVTTSTTGNRDKNWIACDNTPSSPFYGNCYTEWDNTSDGNRIKLQTSSNGGLTWGPARNTGDNATGLGGQPVVRPNGTVLVPINNANQTQIRSFRSIDGGASWRATVLVSSISRHTVAGGLRTSPLPSAEIDAAGTAYVVWQDCRFIPGIGVDRGTSGAGARIGLTYYYHPNAACSATSCQLNVGLHLLDQRRHQLECGHQRDRPDVVVLVGQHLLARAAWSATTSPPRCYLPDPADGRGDDRCRHPTKRRGVRRGHARAHRGTAHHRWDGQGVGRRSGFHPSSPRLSALATGPGSGSWRGSATEHLLAGVRGSIERAVVEGAPEQLKQLLGAVVDRILVESHACIQPYFVAPTVRTRPASRRRTTKHTNTGAPGPSLWVTSRAWGRAG